MPANKGSILLDPNDEFEALVIRMVQMHRDKSAQYGNEEDTLGNFYDAAGVMDVEPLDAAESFQSKHMARLMKWRRDGRPEDAPGIDDAYIDMAVYALICWTLYERGDY